MNKVIRKGDTLREYGGRVLMGIISVLVWGSPARATRSSVTNTV
ncbi:PaaR repeat-containing protein [Klebsiella pneumoniae]|nr:PaaR repeat-containing protein [Klebsiella pneumoniae]